MDFRPRYRPPAIPSSSVRLCSCFACVAHIDIEKLPYGIGLGHFEVASARTVHAKDRLFEKTSALKKKKVSRRSGCFKSALSLSLSRGMQRYRRRLPLRPRSSCLSTSRGERQRLKTNTRCSGARDARRFKKERGGEKKNRKKTVSRVVSLFGQPFERLE